MQHLCIFYSSFKAFQVECAYWPVEAMNINAVCERVVSQNAVVGSLEFRRSLSTTINRTAVEFHPFAHGFKSLPGTGIDGSPTCGSEIEQEISAFAY